MTPVFLLDTTIAIEALRRPTQALQQRLNRESARLATSTVVLSELRHGAARARDPETAHRQVDGFASLVCVLDLDTAAADHAADIRAALARSGTPIGPYDVLIAGHARSRGLVVVTHNVAEFAQIDGLRHEDWAA